MAKICSVGQQILYRLPSFQEETTRRVVTDAEEIPALREASEAGMTRIDNPSPDRPWHDDLAQGLPVVVIERVVHRDRPDDSWVVILPGVIVATQETWVRDDELCITHPSGEKELLVPKLESADHVHLVAFSHDRDYRAHNIPLDADGDPQLPDTWRPNAQAT